MLINHFTFMYDSSNQGTAGRDNLALAAEESLRRSGVSDALLIVF